MEDVAISASTNGRLEHDPAEKARQKALVSKLTAACPDPVQDLVDIFGLNRRTAERMNSGSSRMSPKMMDKLEAALVLVDEQMKRLEPLDDATIILIRLATRRFDLPTKCLEDAVVLGPVDPEGPTP